MCGIAGWVRLSSHVTERDNHFDYYFRGVLSRVAERGPDAFGYAHVLEGGPVATAKFPPGECSALLDAASYYSTPSVVACIANFRGIPTTESDPDADHVMATQPFQYGGYHVTHNGLLSNDRQLTEEFNLPSVTGAEHDIDTYVIPKLLARHDSSSASFLSSLSDVLDKVEGSYAVAGYSERYRSLFFARSFLGLFFTVYEDRESDARYLVWASTAEALDGAGAGPIREFPFDSYNVLGLENLQAISRGTTASLLVCRTAVPVRRVLDSVLDREADTKAVVVLSGGLDSTTVAAMVALRRSIREVHLLHFHYGARAERRETEAVTAIHQYLKERFSDKRVVLEFIDLSFLKNLGGSSLTDRSLEVTKGEVGIETAHEWVPARNLVMISMAAAFCDRFSIGRIMLGLNREESAVFSDNSSEFFTALQPALDYGARSRPKLDMPLGNSMKHHIVRKGLDAGAPLHLTHSCYHGDDNPCGNCGPCWLRLKAFLMNNEREVQKYLSYPDWFPDRLKCEDVG